MTIDERALNELLTESSDLHVDALRSTGETFEELEVIRHEREGEEVNVEEIARFNASRRGVLAGGGIGVGAWLLRGAFAGGLGSALAAFISTPASADTPLDVQILQTAASLEALAVAAYEAAIGLPFIMNGNKLILTFAQTTMRQHSPSRTRSTPRSSSRRSPRSRRQAMWSCSPAHWRRWRRRPT